MAEMKQVPALRFPEFEGDWEEKKMDDIARITSGGTPNRSKPKFWNGHIPWITTSQIDFVTINSANEFITQEGLDNSSAKLFPVGTILMAMYGQGKTRGKVSILGIEATTNQACAALILKKGFDTIFLFQYLSSKYDRIRNIANDGGQQNLSAGLIKGLKIKYPILIEQQKIATFLTALDQRLQLLQQKKTQLEAYKKGVMQKLFSQEVRFKDDNGQDFPDWEEKRLGEVCKKESSTISANSIIDLEGVYKLYGASGYLHSIDFYQHEEPYISIVKDGAGVGRVMICEEKSSVLGTLDVIKPKTNTDLFFLINLINQIRFTQYTTGSTIPHIYFKDYSKKKVKVPSLPEQQKIAAFLTALDEGIAQVAGQIEASTRYKRGLLQKMFV